MANKLKSEKKVAVISMLCEGASICAIERITGIHGDTIGRLAMRVGQACAKIRYSRQSKSNLRQQRVERLERLAGKWQTNPSPME